MPDMNGTRLSDETVAVTVGYFVEFLALKKKDARHLVD